MISRLSVMTERHVSPRPPSLVLMAAAQFLADGFPYLGLLLVFLALPVTLLIIGTVSWGAVLTLVVMDLGVLAFVVIEDRDEERVIRQP